MQRHVGHALHRDPARGVGEGATVRPPEALELGHPPVELVPDQHAVADQIPLLAGDALVVEPDRRQAVLGGAVAGDVHVRRAVRERPELVESGEAGSGVRGLVAQRPVELGGVPDRLVDRQPQVRRVDDEIVGARLDRARRHLLGEQLRHFVDLGVPVPAVAGDELPAATDRRRQAPHRLELTRLGVDPHCGQRRHEPHPLLGGRRPDQVGVELVLEYLRDSGVDVIDAGGGEQPGGPVGQQRDLVGVGDVERVDVVGRDPARVGIGGLVGQFDRLAVDGLGSPSRSRRPARRPARAASGVRSTPAANPQVPSCTTRTANPVSSSSSLPSRLPSRSRRFCDRRRSTRRSACGSPEFAGARQRGVGEGVQRQVEEGRIDVADGHRAGTLCGTGRRLTARH